MYSSVLVSSATCLIMSLSTHIKVNESSLGGTRAPFYLDRIHNCTKYIKAINLRNGMKPPPLKGGGRVISWLWDEVVQPRAVLQSQCMYVKLPKYERGPC